ncbi:MAG TPA: DUF167 family protein [Phycisphaerae bacterium]|nr:DUF167 family protein [Phycisphaerae bacterium]
MRGADQLRMRPHAGGVVIAVKAVPGASRDRVVGVLGDCLKIATSAAAEKGKANRALAAALADALGVSSKSVELVSGPTSPRKEFLVAGLSADEARRRLAEA